MTGELPIEGIVIIVKPFRYQLVLSQSCQDIGVQTINQRQLERSRDRTILWPMLARSGHSDDSDSVSDRLSHRFRHPFRQSHEMPSHMHDRALQQADVSRYHRLKCDSSSSDSRQSTASSDAVNRANGDSQAFDTVARSFLIVSAVDLAYTRP
ncbi:hypothetical protein MRB53_038853 [Persea americana]|nr:hypothetical protein MRB53_038853 [Persea americana]